MTQRNLPVSDGAADSTGLGLIVYHPAAIVLLYVFLLLLLQGLRLLHGLVFGRPHLEQFWPYDSSLSVSLLALFVSINRPKLLSLSRWKPRAADVLVGVAAGLIVSGSYLLVLINSSRPFTPDHLFIPAVVIAPVVEEIIFRATLLRSLRERIPWPVAVPIVTVMAALGHGNVLAAIPSQLVLSLVYIGLRNSLAASMFCHFVVNGFPFLVLLATGQQPALHL